MISTSERSVRRRVAWCLTLWAGFGLARGVLAQDSPSTGHDKARLVTELQVSGAERTSERWLRGFLNLDLPTKLKNEDVYAMQRRLRSSAVFTDVRVNLERQKPGRDTFVLHVDLEEKWTTIPVVRGVYGGGTPLRVLGLYDTHAFGRLLTLGGEARKYGDAPPSFIIYGRAPELAGGRYYVGGEFWRLFRVRELYDDEGDPRGRVSTDTSIGRVEWLGPLGGGNAADGFPWKAGLDLEWIREAPAAFEPKPKATEQAPGGYPLLSTVRSQWRLLPRLQYDDVDIDGLYYDGLRALAKAGPLWTEGRVRSRAEAEAFYYRLWPYGFNGALHGLVGQTTALSPYNQYYLGGFDSIRGLPDGAVYGTRAAYFNAELRHLSWAGESLWLQNVLFFDMGAAAQKWAHLKGAAQRSVGIGMRLAVPQVYRLMLRIDYAWSLDDPKTQGITAGMNHLFQPYRPL